MVAVACPDDTTDITVLEGTALEDTILKGTKLVGTMPVGIMLVDIMLVDIMLVDTMLEGTILEVTTLEGTIVAGTIFMRTNDAELLTEICDVDAAACLRIRFLFASAFRVEGREEIDCTVDICGAGVVCSPGGNTSVVFSDVEEARVVTVATLGTTLRGFEVVVIGGDGPSDTTLTVVDGGAQETETLGL